MHLNEPTGNPLVQQLASMLNTIQDSLLITLTAPMEAPGPVIVYANDAVLHQTGYKLHEVLGRSPRLFQGPDTDQAVTQRFGQGLGVLADQRHAARKPRRRRKPADAGARAQMLAAPAAKPSVLSRIKSWFTPSSP